MLGRDINFTVASTIVRNVCDQANTRIPAQTPELYIALAAINEAIIARLISQMLSPFSKQGNSRRAPKRYITRSSYALMIQAMVHDSSKR